MYFLIWIQNRKVMILTRQQLHMSNIPSWRWRKMCESHFKVIWVTLLIHVQLAGDMMASALCQHLLYATPITETESFLCYKILHCCIQHTLQHLFFLIYPLYVTHITEMESFVISPALCKLLLFVLFVLHKPELTVYMLVSGLLRYV